MSVGIKYSEFRENGFPDSLAEGYGYYRLHGYGLEAREVENKD